MAKALWCEFRDINRDKGCKITTDVIKEPTTENGQVVHCDNQACLDLVEARKIEIDLWISGQKSKEAARLQAEYGNLKTELALNKYSGKTDEQKLAILNDITQGTPDDNPVVSADSFKEAMDPEEFRALSDSDKTALSVFTGGGTINLSGQNTKNILDSIFPGESKSSISIEALRVVKKSIAQNMGKNLFKQEHLERAGLI